MCQYNNIMFGQTLSLQLLQLPQEDTLIKMFNEFGAKQVALKDSILLAQIPDSHACAQFIKKVRSGAFSELKPEVFQILDSPSNAAALMENYSLLFTSPLEVHQYFNPNEYSFKKQQQQNVFHVDQENHEDDHARFDLLTSVYEPSGKIEVQFDDSAHTEVIESLSSPPHRQEVSQETVVDGFYTASVEVVINQEPKKQSNNNVANTQKQESVPQEKTTQKMPLIEKKCGMTSVSLSKKSLPSACLTGVLVLWILWLII